MNQGECIEASIKSIGHVTKIKLYLDSDALHNLAKVAEELTKAEGTALTGEAVIQFESDPGDPKFELVLQLCEKT